tara:strand:- start:719 stop:925 length:207 start_codon:yes stop_codon:yes gene_type:complete
MTGPIRRKKTAKSLAENFASIFDLSDEEAEIMEKKIRIELVHESMLDEQETPWWWTEADRVGLDEGSA